MPKYKSKLVSVGEREHARDIASATINSIANELHNVPNIIYLFGVYEALRLTAHNLGCAWFGCVVNA